MLARSWQAPSLDHSRYIARWYNYVVKVMQLMLYSLTRRKSLISILLIINHALQHFMHIMLYFLAYFAWSFPLIRIFCSSFSFLVSVDNITLWRSVIHGLNKYMFCFFSFFVLTFSYRLNYISFINNVKQCWPQVLIPPTAKEKETLYIINIAMNNAPTYFVNQKYLSFVQKNNSFC